MYTILRTLNNNVAQVSDNNHKSLIVFGRGIAYGKKEGDVIKETDVVEAYYLSKQDSAYFSDIACTISASIINAAEQIITEARKTLKGSYNANLLLMISDHINFALERHKDGIIIGSPLDYEIRRLYQEEIKVGKKALDIIEEELHVRLPEEEVAMIALYLVNGQVGNYAMQEAMLVTEITNDIFNIINYHYQIILDESRPVSLRFMIHLRYLILKYLKNEAADEEEYEGLFQFMNQNNEKAVQCVSKIIRYLKKREGWVISENDQIYLILHVNRVIADA